MNKIVFFGGDKRQKIAAEFLRKQNIICDEFIDSPPKNVNISDYCAAIFPLPTTREGVFLNAPLISEKIPLEKIIERLSEKQLLITGNFTPNHPFYFDLNTDDEFAFLNAIPTAEGAIKTLIESTPFTLWKSKILIIGSGNIGKILAHRLSSFGAEIAVSARKTRDFSYIEAFGYKWLETNNLADKLKDFDIIINTVPSPVIKKREIDCCKENCLFLELSSAPFGIDKQAVILSDREFIYAPALPGKIAPETAGKILGQTIHKILNSKLFKTHGGSDL